MIPLSLSLLAFLFAAFCAKGDHSSDLKESLDVVRQTTDPRARPLISFLKERTQQSIPMGFDDWMVNALVFPSPPGGGVLISNPQNGLVAGCLFEKVVHSPTSLVISFVHVDPGHQRKGYGRQLLRAVENEGKRMGLTSLQLYVKTTNIPAYNLYIAEGYMCAPFFLETRFFACEKLIEK